MRDSRPYGLLTAMVLAAKIEQQRKTATRARKPLLEMTEREQWNAAVEEKKAAKKARKANTKEAP